MSRYRRGRFGPRPLAVAVGRARDRVPKIRSNLSFLLYPSPSAGTPRGDTDSEQELKACMYHASTLESS